MLSACRKQELEEHQRRGWDGGIRTHDIRVKVWCVTITLHPNIGAKSTGIGITPNPRFRGVGKGVRTLDTRNHNPVLSQLSYTHHIVKNGTPRGIRTPGLLLRRQLLYPTELLAHMPQPLPNWLERVMGIEPTYPAWKAGVLPLNYTRRGRPTFSFTNIPSLHGVCQAKPVQNAKKSQTGGRHRPSPRIFQR